MIYKFRIISDEKDDFFRDIEIEDNNSFFDFHTSIQNSTNYDSSYLATFFISNNKWEKLDEITLMDMSENDDNIKPVMHKTLLKDYFKKKKDKAIYIYDMFAERAFYIELIDIKEKDKSKKYPVLVNGNGKAPIQTMLNDFSMISDDNNEDDF